MGFRRRQGAGGLARPAIRQIPIWLGVAAIWGGSEALAWVGTLPDGSQVQVDPDTHKATRVAGDSAVPLWDGVHRLDDGSVVTVRDGTVVPNESMLNAWEGPVSAEATPPGGPCERLVRRACGADNACARAPDCLAARGLLNEDLEAQRRATVDPGSSPATPAGERCGMALADAALPVCGAEAAPGAGPSPCDGLVELVCGTDGRCGAAPPCAPARQLQAQERAERGAQHGGEGPTPSGAQCLEALGTPFFAPCTP